MMICKVLLYPIQWFLIFREKHFNNKYSRWLPWSELLDDRWARAKRLGFGAETSIYNSSIVFGSVQVGSACWIGPNCILDGLGGLTIGDNVQVSAGVQIYSHKTVSRSILRNPDVPPEYRATRIEDHVYLGPGVIVSMGVTITAGCVIGANSFIPSDIRIGPEGSLWFGSPARFIKQLSE